jgi:heptose-I-phosphate ethanolaminephosphotransferase
VLVVGESYNKHHSTLYGYHLLTTPLQQKRKDAGDLYVFNDVVSPWNITSNAMLGIFSLWEYGLNEAIGERPLVPVLFRRAGYQVNFFSNQYLLRGFRKGFTNQAGHFFLADIELSDSLFTYRNEKTSKYDLGLVDQVRDYKRQHGQSPYTLDILHLIGQHFEYSERYPKSYTTFSLANYQEKNLSAADKTILMQYDQATYYNDVVLDSIISLYQGDNAIVLFVSDHGEEAFDEGSVSGRLFQEPTASQARYEFEVPMWIWCSDSYRQSHPDVIRLIRESVNKPFLSDGMPQLLLSLAGISCPWRDDTRNLLSPRYQPKKRIIGGSVDYDELMQDSVQ